ncbi:DUF3098 domain-containing protein [Fulvivirga lutea]|uniref:DUF3098 domain-containing protein n=1 Tax=Fulvivirga lutea TaxID=2810512 RepID=A0A974WEF9_9BACT|nr:DUF3098 domain-containing protein [Fulvivirga lutea]QSE96854.1 DUF3098 domain-containing protein [Fulvivirga lutea]
MEKNNKMPFGTKNYKIMLFGLALLVVGFIVMSSDSEPFGFGFLGLTLGPILVFLGFLVEIAAILYNPKK